MNNTQVDNYHAKPRKLEYDKIHREISDIWEQKAKDLQARRWKYIKQAENNEHYKIKFLVYN
ncbi:MAG: hypothetical protein WCP03_00410 [Candidatus Saccharibacteria bacterium]